MKFFRVIGRCLRKYASMAGTANRSEFWFWIIFIIIVFSASTIIDGAVIAPALGFLAFDQDAGAPLSIAVSIALLLPTIAVTVRRFHDSALSGWLVPVFLVFAVAVAFGVNWLLTQLPYETVSSLSGYVSIEALYFVGFVPLLYVLIKSGSKKQNPYVEENLL